VNALINDVRFGLRMLWKHRLASLICAVALGLGMGATTAIFSMAEGFLLHPVPFKEAGNIVAIVDTRPQQNILMNSVAPATFLDWQAQAKSFDRLGAYDYDEANLTGDREPQRVQAFDITANFFELLGVQPALGRSFLPEEEQPGRNQVIILSHGLWERRYASDPAILTKTIKVDGKTYTVVGVMAKGFDFPMTAEAWLPLTISAKEQTQRDSRYLWVLGHLKPGVSASQAAAEMSTISQRQAKDFPDSYKGWQLNVMSLRLFAAGNLTPQFTILLLGAVGFVLLIACADVANVQFARVTGRQKELAVRTAMGASRGRIMRQLLIESTLLSLFGAALGLFLAHWQLTLMLQHMPADVAKFIAGWDTIRLDAGAFCFALVIAVASGLLSGVAPALLVSRTNVSETLKESGRGSSTGRVRHRLRSALVIAEVALSLVLLVGAGLLVKGFYALLTVNNYSHPETLLTLGMTLPDLKYSRPETRTSFDDRILQRISSLPHVQSAALVTAVPYANGGDVDSDNFSSEGHVPASRSDRPIAFIETVSPKYFSMMNIALRQGRVFSDSDGASTAPVAVISESLARRYFSNESPVGRKIKVGAADSDSSWLTVAGVVADVHYSWIEKDYLPTLYVLYNQSPKLSSTLLVRTDGQPLSLVAAVRGEIASVDPDLPLFEIKSLDTVISHSIVGIAYVAALMGAIGIIALVLASVGVYGVMSYSVSERTHEIGIRMAMGASRGQIQRLIIGNGMLLTIVGMAIGMPAAFALAYGLSSLLFGVTANDPVSFVGLPVVLASVALLASYLPARRALRVDPLVALRYE
jgi:putative ABC transport system permease protein